MSHQWGGESVIDGNDNLIHYTKIVSKTLCDIYYNYANRVKSYLEGSSELWTKVAARLETDFYFLNV